MDGLRGWMQGEQTGMERRTKGGCPDGWQRGAQTRQAQLP